MNGPPKTTLTEFFALCEIDNFAITLLYADVPQYFTWRNKTWSRRKLGVDVPGFPNVKHVTQSTHDKESVSTSNCF